MRIHIRKYVMAMALVFSLISISCAQMDYGDDYGGPQDRGYYDQPVAEDYLVEFYEHADYRGDRQTYELREGMRHVLIEFVGWNMNDRLSSIRIGRGVGVALFRDRDFKGPVAIYEYDTPMIDRDINDWASSAIIFDRQLGGPLGVWLGERADPRDLFRANFSGVVRFFPLSEDIGRMETRYDRIDEMNDNVEWVVLGPATREMFRRGGGGEGYRPRFGSRSRGSQIEVSIYEHGDQRGRSILFPTRFGSGQTFMMKDHNFNRIASSLIIREIRSRY